MRMSFEGIVSDSLNLPNVRTLRHVVSNGQHTYLSQSVDPEGEPCCLLWQTERFGGVGHLLSPLLVSPLYGGMSACASGK